MSARVLEHRRCLAGVTLLAHARLGVDLHLMRDPRAARRTTITRIAFAPTPGADGIGIAVAGAF